VFVQPFFQGKRNKQYIIWVCVCNLRCSSGNAHEPYIHLWSAPLYNICPPYFTKGNIFENNLFYTKYVSSASTNFF